MRKIWVLASVIFATSSSLPAQDDIVHQAVHMDGPGVSNLTATQTKDLYGPYTLQPGIYRIVALHSDQCVTAHSTRSNSEKDYLRQQFCERRLMSQDFYIFPHPFGGYTIRTQAPSPDAAFTTSDEERTSGATPLQSRMRLCAQVARGVIFGPARIDYGRCDYSAGAGDWTQVGAHDQRFDFRKTGIDTYEIGIFDQNGITGDCVAVRGGSRDNTTDLIRWGCNGNADQRFTMKWQAPHFYKTEEALLNSLKYYRFNDGWYRLSSVKGVELQGPSSSAFETIADNGDYCMKRCAELTECKGWTWSAAGFRDQEKPMCHWKTTIGTPFNHGRTALGKVMSGIIRP